MTDEDLTRLLVMLSGVSHELRSLADMLVRIGESLKDIERPGWDEGIPRT